MYCGQLSCQAPGWCFAYWLPHFIFAAAQQGPTGEEICRPERLSDFPAVTQLVGCHVLEQDSIATASEQRYV